MHAVYAAIAGVGSGRSPKGGTRYAKADFFTLHVAARLGSSSPRLDAQICKNRVSPLLGRIARKHAGKKQHSHSRKQRPALSGVPDHLSERVCKTGRDREDRNKLNKVGERRWIFIGMR